MAVTNRDNLYLMIVNFLGGWNIHFLFRETKDVVITMTRELLLDGKAKYSWPPYTN